MKKDYYSLTEISKILEVPASTLRYWKENFLSWLPHQGEGRKMRYHKDSLEIFKYIQQCFNKNISSDDIKDLLSDQYPLQHDVAAPYDHPAADIMPSLENVPPPALNNMSALQMILESVMDKGFGKLTEAIANVQELRDENRDLKERIAKLESMVFKKQQLNNDNTIKKKKTVKKKQSQQTSDVETLKARIQKMRAEKISWDKIADALNNDGVKNPKTGGKWNRKSVQRNIS